jgi:hypothetical protein
MATGSSTNLGSAGPGVGNRLAFTDGYIDGNILALSGGMHNTTQHVGSIGDSHYRQSITTAVANAPQKQRLSLWRGTDGTLYIDNTGSRVVSETPTELKIKNSIGFDMARPRGGWRPAGRSGGAGDGGTHRAGHGAGRPG